MKHGNSFSLFEDARGVSCAVPHSQACASSPLSQELSETAPSGCLEQMSKWPCHSVSHPNANWSGQLGPAGLGGTHMPGDPARREQNHSYRSHRLGPQELSPRLHLYESDIHGPLSLSDFTLANLRTSWEAGRGRERHRGAIMVPSSHRVSSAEAPPR